MAESPHEMKYIHNFLFLTKCGIFSCHTSTEVMH